MTYTTQDLLVARVGEALLISLTDRGTPPTGAIVSTVVDRALADTDALIDGYLAVRYQLPLSEIPAIVADIAGAIAIWKLHTYDPDPKIAADFKAATMLLTQIAAGAVRIPGALGVDPPGTGGTGAQVTDRERTFTADSMRGFI